jgi:hypothetical protein
MSGERSRNWQSRCEMQNSRSDFSYLLLRDD